MKKVRVFFLVIVILFDMNHAQAQIPIIGTIIAKVIKAIDLKIQKIQNETLWLQNAQKTLENNLHQLKLSEVSSWSQKQKDLYAGYFDELWKVKNAITTYGRVKNIISKQVLLVSEYKTAIANSGQDISFTKVCSGILSESLKNLDRLQMVVIPGIVQLSDAGRLEIIHTTDSKIDGLLADLRQFVSFNNSTVQQRSMEQNDINRIKKIYGL
jgi:hypothetical protein